MTSKSDGAKDVSTLSIPSSETKENLRRVSRNSIKVRRESLFQVQEPLREEAIGLRIVAFISHHLSIKQRNDVRKFPKHYMKTTDLTFPTIIDPAGIVRPSYTSSSILR